MMNRGILNPTLYRTSDTPGASKGIYWNPTLGLISLSSDGEERITIADKNLGAANVYNDGDELSELNCGCYFQQGNNYGFPWTGGVTTSSTQVNAANYGPYYESSTFINITSQWDSSWMTVSNRNLWGAETDRVEARRGPCAEGFHVPKIEEYQTMMAYIDIIEPNWWSGRTLQNLLKMPPAGERSQSTGDVEGVGVTGAEHWTCSLDDGTYHSSTDMACLFRPKYPYTFDSRRTNCGYVIRPFKDYAVIPDLSWTKLAGTSIVAGGIFRSESLGLISISSDGENRITMADKNVGATVAWNDGDELSEANCGKFYQRGNNYGFPRSGEIRTNPTQVDATNYGPYYYSDIFITTGSPSLDRSSITNNNLWGGRDDTNKSKKGPCFDGYHVPSVTEHIALINTMTTLGIDTSSGMCLKTYLKMPFAGLRSYYHGWYDMQGNIGYYWSSTKDSRMHLLSGGIYPAVVYTPCDACSIRPFKNEPVVPDSRWTKLF